MGALTFLNLANNSLGELVPPEGWTKTGGGMFRSPIVFKHADGREQKKDPGSKPKGIIAIASAIPDMGALSKLDVRQNEIRSEGQRALQQAAGSRYASSLACSKSDCIFDTRPRHHLDRIELLF
jgi:hypothetical protein